MELYNKAVTRMNVGPNSLSIEICRIGKYIEVICHILIAEDFIWNGIYNFNWFKFRITER
jgi:hypothetical protein